MFEENKQIVIGNKRKWLAPQVEIFGQTPKRMAKIIFPSENENGEALPTVERTVEPEQFDAFYSAWIDDASLYSLINDIAEVPANLEGDITNEV